MIVHRVACPPAGGRKVGVALNTDGTRFLEMGDVFSVIPGMRFTAEMSELGRRHWIERREFVTLSSARAWVKHLSGIGDKQQATTLTAIISWAIAVPIGGAGDAPAA